MTNDTLAMLRAEAGAPGAAEWLRDLLRELDEMRARLDRLEQENQTLTEQLQFFRGRIAA